MSPLKIVTYVSSLMFIRRKMISGPDEVVKPAITTSLLSSPHKYLTPVTTAETDELGKVTEESKTRFKGGSLSVVCPIPKISTIAAKLFGYVDIKVWAWLVYPPRAAHYSSWLTNMCSYVI